MKLFFGTISNDYLTLKRVLLTSELPGATIYTQEDAKSATEGWNELLETAEIGKNDIAVFSHQDIYYPEGWLHKFESGIKQLPDSWIIAGFFGIGKDKTPCGKIWDRRMGSLLQTAHELPREVLNVDGCAFAVNLNKGFRFEELKGFDCYDIYAGCMARELGGTVWVIDAPPEHWATRAWNWTPDAVFMENIKWLKQRFPNERTISTCHNERT